jgi:hypothetical protein
MTTTIQRPIPGFEGRYEITEDGRVYSVPRLDIKGIPRGGFYMKPTRNKKTGYFDIRLCGETSSKRWKIHVLVTLTYHGPRPSPLHDCRHLDGNRTNNLKSNLAWGTKKENMADRELHGTVCKGERNKGGGKLKDDDVRAIKKRLKTGEHHREIAKDFGVSYGLIGFIHRGRVWRHVV